MSSFVDFEALKQRVSIEDAAKMLQLKLKAGNGQFRAPCPACPAAGDRALVITPSKGAFYCWGVRKGGDQIALAAHVLSVSTKEAAAFLGGDQAERPSRPTAPESETGKEVKTLSPLPYLEPDHEAVAAVGFDLQVAKALGVGYAGKGMMRGTVAVPIRDEQGTLLGYIGITEARLPPSFTGNIVRFPKTA